MPDLGRARRVAGACLAVAAAFLIPLAATATWAHRTVLDTQWFTATVADITGEREAEAAIADRLTNEVFSLLALSPVIQVLPPVVDPARSLVLDALKVRVQATVGTLVASDAFMSLFSPAVSIAHHDALQVLRGRRPFTDAGAGTARVATLDLRPLVFETLHRLQNDGVVPASVRFPPPRDPPDALSAVLGVDVPNDVGLVVVYRSDFVRSDAALHSSQWSAGVARRGWPWLIALGALTATGATWLARDRRTVIARLGVAVAAVTVALAAVARHAALRVPEHASSPGSRAIARAISTAANRSLMSTLLVVTVLSLGTAVVATALAVFHSRLDRRPAVDRSLAAQQR
jgi:hypothetical protein